MAAISHFIHDLSAGLLIVMVLALVAWMIGSFANGVRRAFRGEITASTAVIAGVLALIAKLIWDATQ